MNPLRKLSSSGLSLGWTIGLLLIAVVNLVVAINNRGGNSVLYWGAIGASIAVVALFVARLVQLWRARQE